MAEATLCDGQCVDTDVNDFHCGRCNNRCNDSVCQHGACVPAVDGAGGTDRQSGGAGGLTAGGSGGAAGKATGGVIAAGTEGSSAGASGAQAGGSTGANPGGMGGIAGSPPRTGGAGGAVGSGGGATGGSGSWPYYTCPAALPNTGERCGFSGRGASVVCYYDECPAGTVTGPRYAASCPTSPTLDGTWTAGELDCPQAIECGECPPGLDCSAECVYGETCGNNQCPVGEICLRMVYPDGHWNWDCAANDCQGQALDCSCVGEACGQSVSGDWECTAAEDPIITCECVDGC
jgi:hypothetical protein